MYYIKSTAFIKSIADIKVYNEDTAQNPTTEICVVGRSNVGKSSFINLIAGRKNLAKTSSTPGRTRLINLFEFVVGIRRGGTVPLETVGAVNDRQNAVMVDGVCQNYSLQVVDLPYDATANPPPPTLINDGKFTLIDLPGYGYAKAPKTEIAKWGSLMEQYFTAAKTNLKHVFSLIDIRHDPSELDIKMIKFLSFHAIPFTVIATKSDKISNSQLAKHIQTLATKLAIGKDNIILTSTLNTKGKDAVINRLAQIISN